jgi:hypothetical protein
MTSNTYQTERRRGDFINLKTNLPDVEINPKLYKLKRLNVSEIINQPANVVKKFSISSFAGAMRRGFLNTSSMLRGKDLNRTEADLTPFNTMEVLSESSFTSNPLDSARTTTYSTGLNLGLKNSVSNNIKKDRNENTFKMLIKEDYSGYIKILKRIYPSFHFNHYNKINNEYSEYYKKYGEEGDIINRNFIKKEKKEGEYKKSNLLDILGVQENITDDPKKFRIKTDFLKRGDPYELRMIKEDLSFKTGVIDKELNQILESQANILYNYIENNIDLKNQINDFSLEMKNKIDFQKKLSKNYINNSSKLFLKESKKKQIQKLLIPLKILRDLGMCMKQLKFISLSENDNKIKQISDSTNVAREKLKLLKKYGVKSQKGNVIFEIESKIQTYENEGEIKLNDQLAENFERLINLTLIYDQKDEIYNKIIKNSDIINKKSYNISKENNTSQNFKYNEEDFELINTEQNIYIKYLLIYNNNKENNKLYNLLISILDMFDIIIKDNMDISSIVDIFKNLFKKIITKNFEIIEGLSQNKLINVKIISNCYSNILSNFCYTIELIQTNFGLNGRRIFNDAIEMMKTEMDNFIKMLILADLHEKNIEFDNSWVVFLKEESNLKILTNIYFRNSKLNWSNMVVNLYQNYVLNFKDIKTRELTEEYKELLWDQLTNIEAEYQKMFDVLNTRQNINKLIIEPDKIIFIPENQNKNTNNTIEENKEEKNMYLLLENEKNENDKKHRISKFSYCYIKYMYEYLVVYTYSPDEIKDSIINQIMKLTKDILTYSKEIIIDNEKGKINNVKQLTEKETALYCSDLVIIQKCLQNFIDAKNFGNVILPNLKDTIDTLNSLKSTCYDVIIQLTKEISSSFISEFNTLNFNNYKTFPNAKEYNSYTKKLKIFKRIYDNLGNAFIADDINRLFTHIFTDMFNQFKKCVEEKGIIEDDTQLKQFRSELTYIKKVFKLFSLIDCTKYKEIIDELSTKANPNKLPKKKKKAKAAKEEDKEDNED